MRTFSLFMLIFLKIGDSRVAGDSDRSWKFSTSVASRCDFLIWYHHSSYLGLRDQSECKITDSIYLSLVAAILLFPLNNLSLRILSLVAATDFKWKRALRRAAGISNARNDQHKKWRTQKNEEHKEWRTRGTKYSKDNNVNLFLIPICF